MKKKIIVDLPSMNATTQINKTRRMNLEQHIRYLRWRVYSTIEDLRWGDALRIGTDGESFVEYRKAIVPLQHLLMKLGGPVDSSPLQCSVQIDLKDEDSESLWNELRIARAAMLKAKAAAGTGPAAAHLGVLFKELDELPTKLAAYPH